MQTVCILLQTDNHTSTSWLNFYRPDALPDADIIGIKLFDNVALYLF